MALLGFLYKAKAKSDNILIITAQGKQQKLSAIKDIISKRKI